jgi:prophage antirepressor-like protein
MNEMQVFNNPQFGQIRVVEIDEKPFFVGIDIAKNLGYKNPNDAITRHCRGYVKHAVPTESGVQQMNVIPEGDIYRLAARSELPSAEAFESWVFDEVLPEIRQTGAYITNRANPEMLRQKADEIENMTALNEAAKIILPVLEEAGLKPQYKAIALKQIYRKGGMELPIEEMRAERELFDLTSIAKRVGVYSKNDKPHGQAVSGIFQKIDIEDSEKELVTFERKGHSGTTYQYAKSVIEKVAEWLKNNNYPATISFVDSKGKEKAFSVIYKAV